MLLIAALIGLLAVAVSREPGGRLWRMLVEAPANKLNAMTWRQVLVTAIVVVIALCAAELAMADMAWVLAFDIVSWIEVIAATLIVTRLLPGWRAFKAAVGRTVAVAPRSRSRASRTRRIRRPVAKPSDDPDPVWGLAFA